MNMVKKTEIFYKGQVVNVRFIHASHFKQLSYKVAQGAVSKGQFVMVPIRDKQHLGFVVGASIDNLDESKLKEISQIITHTPPLSINMLNFMDWVEKWSMSRKSYHIAKLVCPVPKALLAPKDEYVYKLADNTAKFRKTQAREAVINYLSDNKVATKDEIIDCSDVSASTINTMEKQGIIEKIIVTQKVEPNNTSYTYNKASLTNSQQEIADKLVSRLNGGFKVDVLYGVPGSGKTEVYFDVIDGVLQQGGQALVLLPEISLTNQWSKRFYERFGFEPAIWHSDLPMAKRKQTWLDIANGNAKVCVGARSSLFLPYKNLASIIVDEEHDSSYKQEDGVIYHGRDMAVMRANIENIPIILASATPSVETWHNIKMQKYKLHQLSFKYNNQDLTNIEIIDLNEEKLARFEWISESLVSQINSNLQKKQQSLLFLNRRGYIPVTYCRHCKETVTCKYCDVNLVQHKVGNKMVCHHCGYSQPIIDTCPNCDNDSELILLGPGVERIYEEVVQKWPNAGVEIASSDTLNSTDKINQFISSVEMGDIDIIIATQVLARGYHFPNISLVAVIDADMNLQSHNFRDAEHAWQMMWQVAGRAGRGDTKGRAIIQTYQPEHEVLQVLQSNEVESFLDMELDRRKLAKMPPIGNLAALVLSALNERELNDFCLALKHAAPKHDEIIVKGPADSPIYIINDRFRKRFLISAANKKISLQKYLYQWLKDIQIPNNIRLKIDIDPYQFY